MLLGQGALHLVARTINDLFFVVNVTGVQVPVESLLKGAAAGLAASILTAAPPALEAAAVPPRAALYRSGLEDKARQAVQRVALGGLLLTLLGLGVLLIPTRSLVVSFSGTFAVIIGVAMLTPLGAVALLRAALPVTSRLAGLLGRMAPRDALQSLSRTAVPISALMVAVSVTIGVSLMVDSFRFTVETWLGQTLAGDVYISAPGGTAARAGGIISPALTAELARRPQVADVATLRSVTVELPDGPVNLSAVDRPIDDARLYRWAQGSPEDVWQAMQAGAVIVSEPFASRLGWKGPGDRLTLYTALGPQEFPVAGIFADYASTQGTVRLDLETYRRLWQDPELTAIALYLAPGVDVEAFTRQLEAQVGGRQLFIRANQGLRDDALAVFDRTFAITGVMQLLATVVAFIGVLSALLAVQLDKQRQLGVLRAVGMTARQVWGLVMI